MSGGQTAQPLGPGDPSSLGDYRLVGRLGEGGMGRVYLAESPKGRLVALKVIKGDLANNVEFRRRFRSEVARAREVPPFCTAEVLDADTDHDPPYLVVEYVDGPSLTAVVEERGPLSPANQHGLAVGVAVALTAIHGAGVIHRDLKPSNVLLAPGSPKVIDFGIARGVVASDADTRTDQVVGTIAYMAPERFGPGSNRTLTPAADIFSWGAVVTYAATGRTPFGAELPAALAIRIMTQPPDLDGLHGPLRYLVERALAKEPDDRPTARELLDHLLAGAGTATTVPSRPAAFPQQPEVLAAAGISPTEVGMPTALLSGRAPVEQPTEIVPGPRRSHVGRALVAALTVMVLVLAAAVTGIMTGMIKLPNQAGGAGPSSPTTSGVTTTPPVTTTPAVTTTPPLAKPAPVTDADILALEDTFGVGSKWTSRVQPEYGGTCAVDNGLTVILDKDGVGSYRCPGAETALRDFSVLTTVKLDNKTSCAGVWFRFTASGGGYVLRACPDVFTVFNHVGKSMTAIDAYFPTSSTDSFEIGIRAVGEKIHFFRDGVLLGTTVDSTYTTGRVVLGVLPIPDTKAPFQVSYSSIAIYRPSVS